MAATFNRETASHACRTAFDELGVAVAVLDSAKLALEAARLRESNAKDDLLKEQERDPQSTHVQSLCADWCREGAAAKQAESSVSKAKAVVADATEALRRAQFTDYQHSLKNVKDDSESKDSSENTDSESDSTRSVHEGRPLTALAVKRERGSPSRAVSIEPPPAKKPKLEEQASAPAYSGREPCDACKLTGRECLPQPDRKKRKCTACAENNLRCSRAGTGAGTTPRQASGHIVEFAEMSKGTASLRDALDRLVAVNERGFRDVVDSLNNLTRVLLSSNEGDESASGPHALRSKTP